MSFRTRIFLLLLVEVAYWIATRRVRAYYHDIIDANIVEAFRTFIRAASLAVDTWLFWPLLTRRRADLPALRSPVLLTGVAALLCAPYLAGRSHLSLATATMYTLSVIVVALKEEVLFRGIVQELLSQPLGRPLAILVTSVIFLLWHFGMQPMNRWFVVEALCAGGLLGIVYAYSGSLAAVVTVHALYDTGWYFSFLPGPPLFSVAYPALVSALLLAIAWAFAQSGYRVPLRWRPGRSA